MMQAPKDPTRFIGMICIESVDFIDSVWGNCSLIKGNKYDILVDGRNQVDGYYLVKIGGGLCPHKSQYLKTEQQIRDEKLTELLNS